VLLLEEVAVEAFAAPDLLAFAFVVVAVVASVVDPFRDDRPGEIACLDIADSSSSSCL
jgi:hypothetical protein